MNKLAAKEKWPVIGLKLESLRKGLQDAGWREQGPESAVVGEMKREGERIRGTWWNRGRDPALFLLEIQYRGEDFATGHLFRAAATTADARRFIRRRGKGD